MFWIGLLVGIFIGANIGILVVSLCLAGGKDSKVRHV